MIRFQMGQVCNLRKTSSQAANSGTKDPSLAIFSEHGMGAHERVL
jgi:hypothetical protein